MTAILGRAGIFHAVDPAVIATLTAELPVVHFARRQAIFGEGEGGDHLYIVTSGKVKLGRRASDGRHHLLAIAGPSDMFGELSIVDPGLRSASATALTDVDAVAMHRNTFWAWVADRPELALRLLRVLARRVRRTEDDLSDLIFADVAGRVAKELLRLSQRFGAQDNGVVHVTHNLTQEEIAQLIGASCEAVNKVLTEFTQHGWIRPEGESMLIIDSEALVRRAHLTTVSNGRQSPTVDRYDHDESFTPPIGNNRSRSWAFPAQVD